MGYRSSLYTVSLWVIGITVFGFALHRGIRVTEPSTWEEISSYITYPCICASRAVTDPIMGWLHERALTRNLLMRHKQLLEDYENLQLAYIHARSLYDMHDDLRDLITYSAQEHEEKGRIAQIMIRHIADQSHYYLVDAGSAHGIEQDMVALYKNCIVGRVTHVYPYYCKVVLVTDALCKIAAYCSETKATGIHEGLNTTNTTTLRHVSHLARVQDGDLILSSGEGLIFPRGYAIGNVSSYSHDGLLYSISIKPLLDFNTLQYCSLVRRGALAES